MENFSDQDLTIIWKIYSGYRSIKTYSINPYRNLFDENVETILGYQNSCWNEICFTLRIFGILWYDLFISEHHGQVPSRDSPNFLSNSM